LVLPRRIENGDVEFERLADPLGQGRMVGQIVVGKRMDERVKA